MNLRRLDRSFFLLVNRRKKSRCDLNWRPLHLAKPSSCSWTAWAYGDGGTAEQKERNHACKYNQFFQNRKKNPGGLQLRNPVS